MYTLHTYIHQRFCGSSFAHAFHFWAGNSTVRESPPCGSSAVRVATPYGKFRRTENTGVRGAPLCRKLWRAEGSAVRKPSPCGKLRRKGMSAVRAIPPCVNFGLRARERPLRGTCPAREPPPCRKFRHTESSAARTFPPYGKLRRTETQQCTKSKPFRRIRHAGRSAVRQCPSCGRPSRSASSAVRISQFRVSNFDSRVLN